MNSGINRMPLKYFRIVSIIILCIVTIKTRATIVILIVCNRYLIIKLSFHSEKEL